MRSRAWFYAALSGAMALAPRAPAAVSPAAHSVATVRQYEGLALAPTGDRIAAIETDEPVDSMANPPQRLVVRSAVTGAVQRAIDACGHCEYTETSWSPDGRSLGFLATESSKTLLYVLDGKHARRLAEIQGTANTLRWSPDGSEIALLVTIGAHKKAGAWEASARPVGEIGYSTDEQRLAVVAVSSGALRLISPSDMYLYEYDWKPDGNGFVATAAQGNGDSNWWIATLYAVDAASRTMQRIAKPPVQMAVPRAAPDGRTVAFIGGLMSDFDSVGGDIYIASTTSAAPRDVTPGFHGSFTSLAWRNGVLWASAVVDGKTELMKVDPETGRTDVVWSAPVVCEAGDEAIAISADGRKAATVLQDIEHPPRVFAGPPARMRPITDDNAGVAAEVSAKSLVWIHDGIEVQGWLLGPRNPRAGSSYPMVVQVHGGPGAIAKPYYPARGIVRELIQRGYFVLEPNPRGSFGQGEAFTRSNVRNFGRGDLSDIVAGIDAAEKAAPIDDRRIGIYGVSYGGFMSMWAVTQTNRFSAAVAGAGVADWISYYGQNGINQWMIPFFGASAYDDPAVYRAASPIEFIKQAKTPTLIYVGERDIECPAAQSIEFWNALRAMHVATTLVIYEGEGHELIQPAHLRDERDRTVGWFDRYLSGKR